MCTWGSGGGGGGGGAGGPNNRLSQGTLPSQVTAEPNVIGEHSTGAVGVPGRCSFKRRGASNYHHGGDAPVRTILPDTKMSSTILGSFIR